jgi:outer membrane protein
LRATLPKHKKIGHINFNAVVDQMPETKTVKSQLEMLTKNNSLISYTAMNNEYQSKGQAYNSKKSYHD